MRTFQITPERSLARSSLDAPNELRARWIEAGERDPDALRPLLQSLGAHPLAISACLDSIPASLVTVYGASLLVALPLLSSWDGKSRTYLWILAVPNTVVTVRDGDVKTVDDVIEQYSDGLRLQLSTTSALIYQILDHLVDEGLDSTRTTRREIERVGDLLEAGRLEEFAAELVVVKRALTRFAGTLEEQLYCISSLQALDGEAFSALDLQEYFRDAFLHLQHALRSIGLQTAHINALQQQSQLQMQERANGRLRLLTVMSTIFMPLTLIAGVYGMNFDRMPELGWTYGYYTVVVGMVLIAVAMIIQFYRTGWFK